MYIILFEATYGFGRMRDLLKGQETSVDESVIIGKEEKCDSDLPLWMPAHLRP